jgi:hypothetical protein
VERTGQHEPVFGHARILLGELFEERQGQCILRLGRRQPPRLASNARLTQ